jgi:hypothetical protein
MLDYGVVQVVRHSKNLKLGITAEQVHCKESTVKNPTAGLFSVTTSNFEFKFWWIYFKGGLQEKN